MITMRRVILISLLSLVVIFGSGFTLGEIFETERSDGKFNVMVDENNKVLQRTALGIYVDDEFIAADNKRYRVVRVEGDTAYAKYVSTENIAWKEEWDALPALKEENQKKLKVAVYHTHSDESYVPTDGQSSIKGKGGIYKVGGVFTEKLKDLNYTVIHSYNAHDPHDANAYHRSRRTAVELLKQGPDALIDVHRDAVPPDVYRRNINGKETTQVKLVVGRRNPNMKQNLEFAKILKAAMDKTNPKLFEGIFLAKGSYNQELAPRAMLIEVGAHTNSRIAAQRGVDLFAESLPKAIGVSQDTKGNAFGGTNAAKRNKDTLPVKLDERQSKEGWSSSIWLILIVLVGGVAFLLISTGSWDKAKSAMGKEWGKKE